MFRNKEKLWWITSKWDVAQVIVVDQKQSHETRFYGVQDKDDAIHYVLPETLFYTEKEALETAYNMLTTTIEDMTEILTQRFEARQRLEDRLHPKAKGTNEHG